MSSASSTGGSREYHRACLEIEALAAEAPEPKHHAGSFELAEGTKKILLDPSNSDNKVLTISADLNPK
jgi:hypothetical protein